MALHCPVQYRMHLPAATCLQMQVHALIPFIYIFLGKCSMALFLEHELRGDSSYVQLFAYYSG